MAPIYYVNALLVRQTAHSQLFPAGILKDLGHTFKFEIPSPILLIILSSGSSCSTFRFICGFHLLTSMTAISHTASSITNVQLPSAPIPVYATHTITYVCSLTLQIMAVVPSSFTNACHPCPSGVWLPHTVLNTYIRRSPTLEDRQLELRHTYVL